LVHKTIGLSTLSFGSFGISACIKKQQFYRYFFRNIRICVHGLLIFLGIRLCVCGTVCIPLLLISYIVAEMVCRRLLFPKQVVQLNQDGIRCIQNILCIDLGTR